MLVNTQWLRIRNHIVMWLTVGLKMRSIIFDTGPIISLTMNNLIWTLKHLKRQFKGDFLITPAVKKELIEKPFRTKASSVNSKIE